MGVVGVEGELPGGPTTEADCDRARWSRELIEEETAESEDTETRSRLVSRFVLGDAALTSFWKKLGAMHAGCPS